MDLHTSTQTFPWALTVGPSLEFISLFRANLRYENGILCVLHLHAHPFGEKFPYSKVGFPFEQSPIHSCLQ